MAAQSEDLNYFALGGPVDYLRSLSFYTENGSPKVCLTFGLLGDGIVCTKR